MDTLTDNERAILDGLFAKATLPGYDAALDTTEEERRVAVKHLIHCLAELTRRGARAHLVVEPPPHE
ncbi:MAG: hypothetical protein RLZZ387_2948 [Chloroflexota bacterium]